MRKVPAAWHAAQRLWPTRRDSRPGLAFWTFVGLKSSAKVHAQKNAASGEGASRRTGRVNTGEVVHTADTAQPGELRMCLA
jgi:hypothetical protein